MEQAEIVKMQEKLERILDGVYAAGLSWGERVGDTGVGYMNPVLVDAKRRAQNLIVDAYDLGEMDAFVKADEEIKAAHAEGYATGRDEGFYDGRHEGVMLAERMGSF